MRGRIKDKTILNLITTFGIMGLLSLFRRKGNIKDWFLIYLFKTLVSTLVDVPVVKKKNVSYPKRYFANFFDSNIVFLYLLFPLSCVIYNQFTYKKNVLKIISSVFLFSAPMALVETFLEKKTNLVKYRNGWNGFISFAVLTITFWMVRIFIECIRFLDRKKSKEQKT